MNLSQRKPRRFFLPATACLAAGLFSVATVSVAAPERPRAIGASAAREFPYRLVGRVLFASGNGDFIGSGSVVATRGVVTSASNLYDPNAGFSFNIKFERGRYGNRAPQRVSPTRSVILSGYINNADNHGPDSSRAFARDLAVMRFRTTLGGGNRIPYRSNLTALRQAGRLKEAIGYSGRQIVSAITGARSTRIRSGYFANRGFIAVGGMAGGPVLVSLNSGQALLAIIVSSSRVDAGIRAIDTTARRFLNRNL